MVKDHLIPHIAKTKSSKEMQDALTNLYHSNNQNRKMVLMANLKSNKMSKTDTVASYLTKITQVRDKLATIWETMGHLGLVNREVCLKWLY